VQLLLCRYCALVFRLVLPFFAVCLLDFFLLADELLFEEIDVLFEDEDFPDFPLFG